ncbi:GDSL-type esterase/lipase family protein [Streptomyces sp. NPDC016626]|uniref:GDSL-type esterase/lipase family protein n=1 Tax=Streptomyces sp. NPDC016626 TaxID=3364968 RepID=UPI0036FFB8E1
MEFEIPGLDPEVLKEEIARQVKPGDSLSDAVERNVTEHALEIPGSAAPEFDFEYNGTVVPTSQGIAVVIPGNEVQAAGNWWLGVLGTATSIVAGIIVGTVCVALIGPAAGPVAVASCEAMAGFTTGFLQTMLATAFKGDPITGEVWAEALGNGVLGAIGSAFWGEVVAPWAKTGRLADMFRALATAIEKVGKSLAAWAPSWVPALSSTTGQSLEDVANAILGKLLEAARRRGWETAASDFRLMPLGDSITFGKGSTTQNGYRSDFWDSLTGGPRTVDFVGTQRSGTFTDPDHEGHSGDSIDEIADNAYCSVRRFRPNVITLHAGTNDMNEDLNLEGAPGRLGSLIDQLLRDAPDATVLVATLVPSYKEGLQPRIDAFNAALPDVVERRQDQGKHVRLVDMSDVTIADLSEPAHPGDSGYAKMADAFYAGVVQAEVDGWISDPVAGSTAPCDISDNEPVSGAGPGWRSLGVIAPGMESPEGSTNLVELDGDKRADYLKVSTNLGTGRAALNKPGPVAGKPDWQELPYRNTMAPNDMYADHDGDGRDDLMFLGDGTASWVRNLGPTPDGMAWQAAMSTLSGLPTGVSRDAVRFADVNGDGRDDYLRVGENGAIHAYVNHPTRGWLEYLNWAPGVQGGSRNALRMADVNGDGKADYLQVKSDGSVDAWFNNFTLSDPTASPRFTKHANFVHATPYPADKSTFRDISGDGKADYVVIYDGGAVRAWLNTGGNL